MGILAHHAQTYTTLDLGPLSIAGSKSMPLIWLVAVAVSALAALLIGLLSLRTSGVYFIMITLAFGQMFYYFAISWSSYGGEDGLSIYVRNGFPGLNPGNACSSHSGSAAYSPLQTTRTHMS